jgi:ABC-type amino acid transport substrate-binding protein
MADVTFRGYAMALMQGQIDAAVGMLQTLLGLTTDQAMQATDVFSNQLSDPAFMQKAMGLRTAVESKDDAKIGELLGACFGLTGDIKTSAVAAVRKQYP